MADIPRRRGRQFVYQSQEEKYEAQKARQRERYQQKRAEQQYTVFQNTFSASQISNSSLSDTNQVNNLAGQDDEFDSLQIEDEFDGLLPPRSPSLGSASMDLSEPEPYELIVQEPIEQIENEPLQSMEDDEFEDVDHSVPNVVDPKVEELAIRLTNQLLQFQGCCTDCHQQAGQEHRSEYETHCSLQTFVAMSKDPILSNCPDILGSGRIAVHKDRLNETMSPAQKRWVFSGIHPDDPTGKPLHICVQEGDTPSQTAEVAFDIDSITGFCHSLGIAKGGIRWHFTQMPVSDLQSGLHLNTRRVSYYDRHGHFHQVNKPVHKIPHYTLGRLIGFEDVSLYLLFPRLFREDQQSSRLLDTDFRTWTDQVLLPAIYGHHNSTQLQHYPSSYDHGKYNSTARGVEGRSRKVDVFSREQQLIHLVPPDALATVWDVIQQTIQQPGLQQFQGVTILLHAKNLKTLIKGTTWDDMMTRLQRYWGEVVNEEYMSADFYFDIGKETCPRQTYLRTVDVAESPPADVLLWKKCCLNSYYEWCRGNSSQNEPPELGQPIYYPTALLNDAASMNIKTTARSQLRTCGLLYSQFYGSVKEVFAAGNQYPFSNTAIETLALDPQLRKTWQHVGAGLSHDPVALIKAYLYAKARCHHGLEGSIQKSFGVREEHRISITLLKAIDCRFTDLYLRHERLRPTGSELPYVTQPTATVLSWYRWNINKFCVGFEIVHSLSGRQWITWEHTRMMLMFLRCLRFSYGGGHPKEAAGCWRDVRYVPTQAAPDGFRRMEGLGFEVTLPQYGCAWFLEKIDWTTMTFATPHGPYMLFNNPSMQQAYHARYGQIRDVREDFIRISKIEQWIQQFEGIPTCQSFLEDVLLQICLRTFRKDVFHQIKDLIRKKYREEALAGKVALCWPSVDRILRPAFRPAALVSGKRLAVQSIDVLFAWLWGWKDNQFQRNHWNDKPYRLLYQRSFEMIQLVHGKQHARAWKQKLKSSFVKSHWLLPYPQGDRFIKRHPKEPQQVCWWSSNHAGVHRYYQQQDGLNLPLSTSDISHLPLDGWESSMEYMPYEIEPEHELADLSENATYDRVQELAIAAQLVGAIEAINPGAHEIYRLDVNSIDHVDSIDLLSQAEHELEQAKAQVPHLQYRRKRPTRSHESSSEAASSEEIESSDNEGLGASQQRLQQVINAKTDEILQLRETREQERQRAARSWRRSLRARRAAEDARAREQQEERDRSQQRLAAHQLKMEQARQDFWARMRALDIKRWRRQKERQEVEDRGRIRTQRVVLGEMNPLKYRSKTEENLNCNIEVA
jgi:hypothetical protein